MKGFEVAEQFRKLERGDAFTLPLIGISGNSGTQLVEQAIASGMNAMMLKPITRKSQLAYMNIFLKEENYSKVLASRMHKRLNEINKDLSVSKYKADIVSYLVNHHDLKEIINYTAEHLLAIAGCRRVLMYYEEGGQCHEWCAQGVSSCPVMLSCGALHASDGEYECRCGGKSYIREINVGGKLFGRLAVQYGEQSRALGEQLLHEASGIVTMAVERSIAEKNQQNMMAMLEERSLETQSANELILGMLNSIPIPFFVKDIKDDFRYLMCNDAYVAAISKAKEDIIGHTDSELFSQKMGTKIREDDLTAVNSANRFLKKFNVNDQWIWSNGRIYDETKQLFTDKNDRRLLLCTAEDVTDAKYEIVRAKFKSDITTFLSKNVDCDEILEYVALQLREVTDCDFIVLHCADGSHREWAKDGSHWTCDYCGQCFFVNSQGPQFDAEHIAEVTDISHVAGAKVPAKCRAHAIMSHQIMFQEKVWGQLAIHYAKECQAFPKSMRNLLQIAADVMTSTLEREEYITHIKMERDNAIAAEKAKNFFFATVSHDIRTPLNSIVGFSELLKRGEDDPKVRENYLDAIMVSSKKLESLITDVLDISKLEADKMKFFYEMIELSKLFDSVCVIFEQKAREKGIALTIECKDIPVVSIDQHRVRQILLNLVGNAVKYTEKGSVSIRASFERKNESIGELTVAVADTGIGIQKEDLENVMKPFAQLRKSDQVDGTGLGLTVCYQLLKRMNGEMSIESTVGKGSVLTMVLHDVPYKMEERKNEVEVKAGSVSQETTVPLNYETVKLLLVDDSKLNLMVLQKMCVKMGFKEIAMAEDGLKALEVMEAQPIDIVLTDIRMPNMRGEELVAKIRQDERFKNLPVFAVTAEVDALRTYSQAGFTGILLKPLNIDKINGCLDAVMKGEPVALE
ncbi:MAG: response regulator, partial [Victivallales bacterium]|nr:response regulator [Victivallales bacterium]